jgi:hypothetical protein
MTNIPTDYLIDASYDLQQSLRANSVHPARTHQFKVLTSKSAFAPLTFDRVLEICMHPIRYIRRLVSHASISAVTCQIDWPAECTPDACISTAHLSMIYLREMRTWAGMPYTRDRVLSTLQKRKQATNAVLTLLSQATLHVPRAVVACTLHWQVSRYETGVGLFSDLKPLLDIIQLQLSLWFCDSVSSQLSIGRVPS